MKLLTIVGILILILLIAGCTQTGPAPQNNQTQNAVTQQTNNQSNSLEPKVPTANPALDRYTGKKILLFVDKTSYDQLSDRLERYKQDVKSDIGSDVIIYSDDWTTPTQIRNILESQYGSGNLLGSVLVGSIPFTYVEYNGQETIDTLTDIYYQDLDGIFTSVNSSGYVFSQMDYQANSPYMKKEVWSSRIIPPVGGQEGITLLQDYFDKDHDYRTGKITYNGIFYFNSLLVNHNSGLSNLDSMSGEEYNNRFSSLNSEIEFPGDPLKVFYGSDLSSQKASLLQEITKPYKIAITDIHGTPDSIWLGGSTTVTSDEIKIAKSNSMFVTLLSCSNGAFDQPNYIAGNYLFYGSTLAVQANTVITMVGGSDLPSYFDYLKSFSTGIIIGEVYQHFDSLYTTQIFGDPTLRMIDKNSIPKEFPMSQSTKEFGLGNVDVNDPTLRNFTVVMKNAGNAPLEARYVGWDFILNGKPIVEDYGFPFTERGLTSSYEGFINFRIEPGQSRNIFIVFKPYDVNKIGLYTGRIYYATNDPANPFITIEVHATVSGSADADCIESDGYVTKGNYIVYDCCKELSSGPLISNGPCLDSGNSIAKTYCRNNQIIVPIFACDSGCSHGMCESMGSTPMGVSTNNPTKA
jgi:hypothetical protein